MCCNILYSASQTPLTLQVCVCATVGPDALHANLLFAYHQFLNP